MAKVAFNEAEINKLRLARWRARTDLGYLCREVLGYKDVDDEVHGPLMRTLQQFPVPSKKQFFENDVWNGKSWEYTPVFSHVQDLPSGRRRLILAHRGLMKCESPFVSIRCEDGSYKYAKDIKVGDRIAGQLSEDSLEYGYTTVTGVEWQKPQSGYRVKFRSGRELEVSYHHPFRTLEGWTNAEDLKKGTRIALQGHAPEPKDAKDIPDAELVGWFLGDGSCASSCITNSDNSFLERISGLASVIGLTSAVYKYDRSAGIRIHKYQERIAELGLIDSKAGDKFIPEIFFKSSNASISKLLYGLFMSDGTLGKDACFLTTKSKQLAKDVQRLLLRFNVFSMVKEHWATYKGEKVLYWVCRITSSQMIQRFIDAIGWDKLNRFEFKTNANPNTNTVPRAWRKRYGKYVFGRGNVPVGFKRANSVNQYDTSKAKVAEYAAALGDSDLEYLASDAIFWDFVESIEFLGDIETIGIETDSHTLALDDIVTHNTTVNVQAHTIQWIINYPSLAMAIFQSTGAKAEAILDEIRNHFKNNEVFRRLFPEHCPQKNVQDWGTKERLTTLARPKSVVRREPTIMALSIDKGTAGYHFDVIKHSDIVEENNVKSIESINSIIDSFDLSKSLLVSPAYWIDVEGTLYHTKDLYNKLLDDWWKDKNKGLDPEYIVHIQGCFRLLDPKTRKQQATFTPETLKPEWVQMKDAVGKPIPWWAFDSAGAPRFTADLLLKQQESNPYVFSCQYLLKPQGGPDGKNVFELENIQKISLSSFHKNIRPLVRAYTIGLDTAFTEGTRSNHSAFVVVAWDAAGRAYVREIVRKKLLPEDLIKEIFRLNTKYKPQAFVIEETQFVTGLRVGIETEFALRYNEMVRNRIPWNLEFVKPDNQKSKLVRIYNTLQAPFSRGDIRLVVPPYDRSDPLYDADAVEMFEASLKELSSFPLGDDDFLDALADIYQKKDYFGRLGPRDPGDLSKAETEKEFLHALGIEAEAGYRFPKR